MSAVAPVKEHPVEAAYPLSPLQYAMLFHHGSGPDPFVRQVRYELDGQLDADAFVAAWAAATNSHPALRTALVHDGLEAPLQVVARRPQLAVSVDDLRALTEDERAARTTALAADELCPFDLQRPPLWRARLVLLAEARQSLVLTFHHAILDGWSLPIVLGDVFLAYAQLVAGAEPVLPPRRPFRDYVSWLQRQPEDAATRHWSARLAGVLGRTPLPGELSPTGRVSHREAVLELDAEDTARLAASARALGVTGATQLHAAWALALACYADARDVVFGTMVSGRPDGLDGVEEMVGLFVNTIPVRLALPRSTSVGAWLRDVQRTLVDDREHGSLPLGDVARRAGLRLPGRLLDSLVVYENAPVVLPPELARYGDVLRVTASRTVETDGLPFVLTGLPGEHLQLEVNFDADRVDERVVPAVLEEVRDRLLALASRPDATLGALVSHVPPPARTALRPDPPAAALLAFVDGVPAGRTALVRGSLSAGYGELRTRAAAVGARLRELGVGPEVAVALAFDDLAAQLAAVFGVWRAGGACVPLAPGASAAACAELVGRASARCVLSDRPRPELDALTGVPVIDVDALPSEATDGAPAPAPDAAAALLLPSPAAPGELVVLDRRAVSAAVRGWVEAYGLRDAKTYLTAGVPGSAGCLFEVLSALAAGATAVVAARSAGVLARTIEQSSVELLHLPGHVARSLLEYLEAEDLRLPTVSDVLVAGPRPTVAEAARLASRLGDGARVTTVLGAAETALDAVFARASGGTRALSGARASLVSRSGATVPHGGIGTLALGGEALARGYLGQPGATAARFVPVPSAPPGARAFWTGERFRNGPDGALDLLDTGLDALRTRAGIPNADAVEASLAAMPGVEAAALLAHDGKALVRLSGDVDTERARVELAGLVPDLDADVVVLEGAPDRDALRRAGSGRRAAEGTVEAALADAMAKTLGVESVGADDSFFELGGDSLLALAFVARARANGLAIALADVLDRETVARLARTATGNRSSQAEAAEPGELPLGPAQLRYLAGAGSDPAHLDMVESLDLEHEVEATHLEAAVRAVEQRHAALRTRFRRTPDGWRQLTRLSSEAGATIATIDLRHAGRAHAHLAAEAAQRDLRATTDLESGRPWSVLLVRLPGGVSRIVVAVHHLVFDPYSWRILLSELLRALLLGPESISGDVPPAYAAWTRHLEQLATESGADAGAHWSAALGGSVNECPVDLVFGENDVRSTQEVAIRLSRGATARLEREAARTGIDVLLAAALARAYARWADANGLELLIESSGRDLAPPGTDFARTIGWFTCLVPVWIPAGDVPPAETVAAATDAWAAARPYRGLWERARIELPASAAVRPEPALALDYVGQLDREDAAAPGVRIGAFEAEAARTWHATYGRIDPTLRRDVLIRVEAYLLSGRLHARFAHSANRHRRESVAALAHLFRRELRAALTQPLTTR